MVHIYNILFPSENRMGAVLNFINAIQTNRFNTAYFYFVLITVYSGSYYSMELYERVQDILPNLTQEQIQFLETLQEESGEMFFFPDHEEEDFDE